VITTCRICASLRRTAPRCDDGLVSRSRLLAAAAPAILLACATARTPTTPAAAPLAARVEAPGLLFELHYTEPDTAEAARIEQSLLLASARVARWGSFREGVFVRLFPDHGALEDAIGRRGYPWLRAWALRDQVLLQSPRSWAEGRGAGDEEVVELLSHELTHVLMYQRMMPPAGPAWSTEEPPLWFREGMASVTAGQGQRRLSPAELLRWLDAHPGADPLRATPELQRTEREAVYGAAHRAFDLLLEASGEDAVREVLRRVSLGAAFADAFAAATGHPLADFERQALRGGFDPAALRLSGRTGSGGP
jgi:hypothetical protein